MIQNEWMELIIRHLHSDNINVYKAAVRVISASASANPEVQKYCIEKGENNVLTFPISFCCA